MRQKLILMTGLPGSGKSTVARMLSQELSIPLVSIDPIEAAMWQSGLSRESTGIVAYVVAHAVAEEQLKLGHSVIGDAVYPIEASRCSWRSLAKDLSVALVIIECICSDMEIHKQRIEARMSNVPGVEAVTWARVEQRRREYEPWQDERLCLDTSEAWEAIKAKALACVRRSDTQQIHDLFRPL